MHKYEYYCSREDEIQAERRIEDAKERMHHERTQDEYEARENEQDIQESSNI
jgi:hypothetical protein